MALYLLLTAIGAQADLKAVLEAPIFLAAGVLSMANVGGAASAPVVAGVYHPAMAPVGLLMAVCGYILGIYAALGCAWILSVIGGG